MSEAHFTEEAKFNVLCAVKQIVPLFQNGVFELETGKDKADVANNPEEFRVDIEALAKGASAGLNACQILSHCSDDDGHDLH